jgi:hypothetical protein
MMPATFGPVDAFPDFADTTAPAPRAALRAALEARLLAEDFLGTDLRFAFFCLYVFAFVFFAFFFFLPFVGRVFFAIVPIQCFNFESYRQL